MFILHLYCYPILRSTHPSNPFCLRSFSETCNNRARSGQLLPTLPTSMVWSSENLPNTYSTSSRIPLVSKISFEVCLPRHFQQPNHKHAPGILHTIFFHRYFPSIRPSSIEVLDLTLPLVADPELETLIDTRVGQLIRQLSSTSSPKSSVRGSLVVQFFEKKRRKGGGGLGWFTGGAKGDEEVCWESWCLEVTLATPKTEIGRPTESKKSIRDPP